MVSNMKKTLAGVALAALPLMASAQMEEMQDQSLANVSGQLGIIDITNLGADIPFPFIPLFAVPGGTGPALIGLPGPLGGPIPSVTGPLAPTLIGLPGSVGFSLIDFEWTNFGPTVGPFSALNIGVFDVIPGIGPDLISLPEAIFKSSVLGGTLGGVGAAIGTTYILQNGLTLPVPVVGFRQVQVI